MAYPTEELIIGLRKAAEQLRSGSHYAWGNHGACNCGHLVQMITGLSEKEILRYAHTGIGEWTELGTEYCTITQAPLNLIITKLQEVGLNTTDIHHIEYLSDKEVLSNLPGGFRWLQRNKREDVISYFEAFAEILEEKWLQSKPLATEELFLQATPELN